MEDTTIFAQGQEAVFVSKDGNCYPCEYVFENSMTYI